MKGKKGTKKRGRFYPPCNPPKAVATFVAGTCVFKSQVRDGYIYIPYKPGVFHRYVLPVLGDEHGCEINQ